MFSPEEQQIRTCFQKCSLDSIEEELINQRSSSLPALEAENDQKYRQTIKEQKTVRTSYKAIERLNLKNVKLSAQRMQLKRQNDDILESLKSARQDREKMQNSLMQEEREIEMNTRKYEDSLKEKAEQFRKTHGYYNEEEINTEIDKVNIVIAELKDGMSKKQRAVDGLRAQMDAIHPEVAENILEQLGNLELKGKVKILTEQYEELKEKLKTLKYKTK